LPWEVLGEIFYLLGITEDLRKYRELKDEFPEVARLHLAFAVFLAKLILRHL